MGTRVKLESIVRDSEAEGAVTDIKDLKGLVSGATLVPGEQLVRARFVDATAFRATGASVEVPEGLSQITIKLDPERALGGVLTPGAKVGVTASFDSDSGAQAETHMILHDVLVTNVQANDDGSGSKTFSTSSGDKSDTKAGASPTGMVLVTLALDVPSAEHVVFAAERGSVWLSLEPDNVGTGGSKTINRNNALS
jgi:pilus assembly protein CpaB